MQRALEQAGATAKMDREPIYLEMVGWYCVRQNGDAACWIVKFNFTTAVSGVPQILRWLLSASSIQAFRLSCTVAL
jgi:hypothetical protein